MIKDNQIHEVFVDSAAMHQRDAEPLAILEATLGAFAIDQVAELEEADAMIVVGGDGTFLHCLRRRGFPDIPATGINTGTLGFYMDTAPNEEAITDMVRQLAVGSYATKSLPLLEVPLGNGEASEYAANEVVVARKGPQAFQASLKLGEGEFEHFVGDGFIFSTPQGSTSYSLSAGGPILQEDVPAYIVTPSNPHRSHHYFSLNAPTVVSAGVEALVTVKETDKRPFEISVDDHVLDDWPEGDDRVRVRVAHDKQLRAIRFNGRDYFSRVSAAFRGTHA